MPSLSDLRGPPPVGYRKVLAFARQDQHPPNWFIEEHDEFTPALVILGAYYDVEAVGEWDARAEARARFERELAQLSFRARRIRSTPNWRADQGRPTAG